MNFDFFKDDLKDIQPPGPGLGQNEFPASLAGPGRRAITPSSLPAAAAAATTTTTTTGNVSSLLQVISSRPVAGRRAGRGGPSGTTSTPLSAVADDVAAPKAVVPAEGLNPAFPPQIDAGFGAARGTEGTSRPNTITATTAMATPVASGSAGKEKEESIQDPFEFLGWGSAPAAEAHSTAKIIHNVEQAEPDPAEVRRAAEQEKQNTEMRSLYASLDAITAELNELEDKLDTRQAKEEAELAELCTTQITKSMELEEQERQLTEAREAVRQGAALHLEAMSSHYSKEMNALTQRTRDSERERYQSQLHHLQESFLRLKKSVTDLRHKRMLLIRETPYTSEGIRLALSVAKEEATAKANEMNASHSRENVTSTSADATSSPLRSVPLAPLGVSSTDAIPQQQGQSHYSLSSAEEGRKDDEDVFKSLIHAGLLILQGYYDARLNAIKQHVVDYIHSETLEATHAARVCREEGWVEKIVNQKREYDNYLLDMMQRYFSWHSQRAALKKEALDALREDIQSASAQRKEESKQRLARLTAEVAAKGKRVQDQFEQSASERCQAMERQAMLTREADSAIRQAQEAEVEGRCETEAAVRRQLWRAELDALQGNLSKMRSRAERQTRERFEKLLLDATSTSGRCGVGSIEAQLKELRGYIQEQVLSEQQQRGVTGSDVAPYHSPIAETEQRVRILMCTAQQQQDQLVSLHQRCDELRQRVHGNLIESVEHLQAGRQAQKSQQNKVDFARKIWERNHKENLAASIRLELPVLASSFSPTDKEPAEEVLMGLETLAPSGDVTLVYLLQLVVDRLRERDAWRKKLRTEHQQAWSAQGRELADLGSQYDDVCQLWISIVNTFNELQRAESFLAAQQVEVHTEAARAKLEGERLENEQKSLTRRHDKLEEQMKTAKKGLDAALAELERQKQQLQQLSEAQLLLLQEQYHLATQQQRLPQPKALTQPTMGAAYGDQLTRNSLDQGVRIRSAVVAAASKGAMASPEGEKNTPILHEITQHQQVFHSSLTSVLPAGSTHYTVPSSPQSSTGSSTQGSKSVMLPANPGVTTRAVSSLAVLSPTVQNFTHLPESAGPQGATLKEVVA